MVKSITVEVTDEMFEELTKMSEEQDRPIEFIVKRKLRAALSKNIMVRLFGEAALR